MEANMDTRWMLFSILGAISGNAAADVLAPVTDASIRDGLDAPKDGIPDMVMPNAVIQVLDVPQFEDRGIIEYSLAGLSTSITQATLTLPVYGSNLQPFRVDVFAYPGDGRATVEDWA